MANLRGVPLGKAEFTFVPLIDGQLDFSKQFVLKSNDLGGLVMPPRVVPEQKPTLNASKLHSNPFGVIDVTGRNPAYRVQVSYEGVTATNWLKVWHLVQGTYRGQRDVGFMTLRFNVPEKALLAGNLVQQGGSPFADGNLENYTDGGTTVDVLLERETAIGQVRFRAQNLPERFVIETLATAEGSQPVVFHREVAGTWASAARNEDGWITFRGNGLKVRTVRFRSETGQPFHLSEVEVAGIQR
jgi:hypothetical protein